MAGLGRKTAARERFARGMPRHAEHAVQINTATAASDLVPRPDHMFTHEVRGTVSLG